ncbi:MAG TPA: 2-oxo-4-hydroxy-4-carboxy-5-ureidoimidazoline decarboxylase, partial [Thermomicrobiales bacterium]|nr:2-oxo-4-hydroxy-4-carboxy-5-ureidoimidazoline decarboxylase [Thermomicrobiales bacterium]
MAGAIDIVAIDDVNSRSESFLLERLGHLFEHSPWIVEEALRQRPFASRQGFHEALVGVMNGAEAGRQLALIQAHPDLVGRAALAGTLTRSSTREQAAAGLGADDLTGEERD